MKSKDFFLITLIGISLYSSSNAEARGMAGGRAGGGEGMRGGGNFHEQGQNFARSYSNRSPSMSSQAFRPNASSQRFASGQHLGSAQNFARPSRSELQNQLSKVQKSGINPQNLGQKQQNFNSAFSKLNTSNGQTARNLQNAVRQNHPNYNGWFGKGFFNQHGYPGYGYGNADLWAAAGWGSVSGWLGWNDSPLYYDDEGTALAVPYDQIDQSQSYAPQPYYPPAESAPTYAPQPTDQTNSGEAGNQGNWLPLGVFALGEDATKAALSNLFVQLVLNHDGTIDGTYYNATLDQTQPVDGMVVSSVQQAAIKLSNNPSSPLLTAGVYNLTQNIVPIQIHFTTGEVKNWVMVRLQNN